MANYQRTSSSVRRGTRTWTAPRRKPEISYYYYLLINVSLYDAGNQNSAVSTVTMLREWQSGVRITVLSRDFLFSKTSGWALGLKQPPMQLVSGFYSWSSHHFYLTLYLSFYNVFHNAVPTQDVTNPFSLPSLIVCLTLLSPWLHVIILHFSHDRSNWFSPSPLQHYISNLSRFYLINCLFRACSTTSGNTTCLYTTLWHIYSIYLEHAALHRVTLHALWYI